MMLFFMLEKNTVHNLAEFFEWAKTFFLSTLSAASIVFICLTMVIIIEKTEC